MTLIGQKLSCFLENDVIIRIQFVKSNHIIPFSLNSGPNSETNPESFQIIFLN